MRIRGYANWTTRPETTSQRDGRRRSGRQDCDGAGTGVPTVRPEDRDVAPEKTEGTHTPALTAPTARADIP